MHPVAARLRPWIFLLVVFAALAAAYFFAFKAAREAKIQDVPLANKGSRP